MSSKFDLPHKQIDALSTWRNLNFETSLNNYDSFELEQWPSQGCSWGSFFFIDSQTHFLWGSALY